MHCADNLTPMELKFGMKQPNPTALAVTTANTTIKSIKIRHTTITAKIRWNKSITNIRACKLNIKPNRCLKTPRKHQTQSSITFHLDLSLTETTEVDDVVAARYVWKTFCQRLQINGSKPKCSVRSFVWITAKMTIICRTLGFGHYLLCYLVSIFYFFSNTFQLVDKEEDVNVENNYKFLHTHTHV